MRKERINYILIEVFFVLLVFAAGWLAGSITGFSVFSDGNLKAVEGEKQQPVSTPETIEKTTPGDWVRSNDIKVYDDQVVLNIKNAEWSEFTNTHSMEPVLGVNSNAIEVVPKSENEINIGDVVAYNSSSGLIIHRVVKKDVDENGTYFTLKGDNNPVNDPGKIRFNQIERVLVAIIY